MPVISQAELDRTLAGREDAVSSGPSNPAVPAAGLRKFSALYNKKFPHSPCVITQDELDRTLLKGKS